MSDSPTPSTRRIWIITEVVEGGRPGSTYVEAARARRTFAKMAKELGYRVEDDLAWDEDDADRNFIALDWVDIPA